MAVIAQEEAGAGRRNRWQLAGGGGRRLRIAVLSPVWFPVPPAGYGGIERVVSLLADGLADAGHDVTLFASGDSYTRAELASEFPFAPAERIGDSWIELRHALRCLGRAEEFDLISDHSGPLAAGLSGGAKTRVLHTVHGPLDETGRTVYRQLTRLAVNLGLVSLSSSQRRAAPELPWVATCPNAIELAAFPFAPVRGDYLAFVGRMSPDKGCDRAIEVARRAGLPLRIAAKSREPLEQAYFERYVRPHLGSGVEYLGEIGHREKIHLLQGARALLFPIDWEEPFGLVVVEAMACGTPVIATRRGSVPELIDDGRTGIIVDDYLDMVNAIAAADRISPFELRREVEERFGPERMVREYLALFRRTLAASFAELRPRRMRTIEAAAG